jgi:hypothetical protein
MGKMRFNAIPVLMASLWTLPFPNQFAKPVMNIAQFAQKGIMIIALNALVNNMESSKMVAPVSA